MRVLPKLEVHRAAIIFGGRGAALPDGGPYKCDECHHSHKRVSTSRPLPFQHDYFHNAALLLCSGAQSWTQHRAVQQDRRDSLKGSTSEIKPTSDTRWCPSA